MQKISFVSLVEGEAAKRKAVLSGIEKVMLSGKYILGEEVYQLEEKLQKFCGVENAITCANGTDAIVIALRAVGVKAGDLVLVPSFTFLATVEAVVLIGAEPVFIDVTAEHFTMCSENLGAAIRDFRKKSKKVSAVISVDLFGNPANYSEIAKICDENDLRYISDAAQAFGAEFNGKKVGAIAQVTTSSFYPTKPLGCFGDGGGIFTNDSDVAKACFSLRNHGVNKATGEHDLIGYNSRLDSFQAVALLEKLKYFEDALLARKQVAERYSSSLSDIEELRLPTVPIGCKSAWAQYTLVASNRDALKTYLDERGIGNSIYYLTPVHKQPAYRVYKAAGSGLKVTENLSKEVISIPIYPDLSGAAQDFVIKAIREFYGAK